MRAKRSKFRTRARLEIYTGFSIKFYGIQAKSLGLNGGSVLDRKLIRDGLILFGALFIIYQFRPSDERDPIRDFRGYI